MDITKILLQNYEGSEWTISDNDYSSLIWHSDTPKPSEAELVKQWADVEYKIAADAVKQARHNAYVAPNGSDAVFLKWQRGEATKQEWLDAVQAINDAHPYHEQA